MNCIHPSFSIDMAKCFAVLWIPTVNHVPVPFDKPYHNGGRTIDISDIQEHPFPIKIKARGKNIDILLSNEECPDEFELFLTLKYEGFSHNGMVKYSYDEKFLEDSNFGFSAEVFPEAVYHMIKSLYHVHEFHEDESDSSLQPYLSSSDIDIRKSDNAALRHYLENYERTVLNLVSRAKKFLRYVVDMEKEQPETTIREYEAFPNMYVMALGYDTYIHSLYDSVYNRECRTTNEQEKQLRRRAFNIENSVRYFHVLYVFFDTKIRKNHTLSILKKAEENLIGIGHNLETSETNLRSSLTNLEETKKAAKSSTIWAVASILIGFIVGIAGICYSINLSKDSSRELQETRMQLEKTINESVKDNELKLDTAMTIMKANMNSCSNIEQQMNELKGRKGSKRK